MRSNSGYSLVELSVVLVIIGLLVGGALYGKSLIRAAELRSVVTEEQMYVNAVNAFRDKYNCLPGDCVNATKFFGSKNQADGFTGCNDVTEFKKTCNGNGDGNITYSGYSTPTAGMEWDLFWQHLADAGLISGQYTGAATPSSGLTQGGVNVPNSKIKGGVWGTGNEDWRGANNGALFNVATGNELVLGKNTGWNVESPILTPTEMYSIDIKIDDGKPATGGVIVRYRNNNCTTEQTATGYNNFTADYLLTSDSINCVAIFTNAF